MPYYPPPPIPAPIRWSNLLHMVSPEYLRALSDEGSYYLASTPVRMEDIGKGHNASYSPGGKDLRGRGSVRVSPNQKRVPSHLGLHEGIHAWDFRSGGSWLENQSRSQLASSVLANLPLAAKRQLYHRYYVDGQMSPLPGLQRFPEVEMFATGGMYGPEGIPVGMEDLYRGFYTDKALQRAIWNRTHGR